MSEIDDILTEVSGSCQVTRARIEARALTRIYNEALAPIGLRSTEYAVLIAVGKLQNARMHEVAEGLDMDLSTLTRSLGSLDKKGFVRIAVEGHRTRRVSLTDEGRAKVAEGYPGWTRAQEAAAARRP